MKEKIQKVLHITRWVLVAIFAFMSLVMFGMKNPVSGFFNALFSVFISPVMPVIFDKLHVKLNPGIKMLIGVGIFSALFVTFVLLTDYETEPEPQNEVAETSIETKEVPSENSDESKIIVASTEAPITEVEDVSDNEPKMKVHFLDVGQGDCSLVECDNHYMLIDAGPDDCGTKIQKYLMDNGVDKLDYLLLSHPDSDHIGSADVIVTKFEIDKVLMSSFIKDNSIYLGLLDALSYKGYSWEIPKQGDEYPLGEAMVSIIQSKEYSDPNNSSICLKITMENVSYLFAGDSEEISEQDILLSGEDISSTVYHVSHHGSYSSSSQNFLNAMSPEYGVISCGKDNSYGHPHQETVDKLRDMNVAMFRTDIQGTIVSLTDGKIVEWSTVPDTEYKGGSSDLEKAYKDEIQKALSEVHTDEEKDIPLEDKEREELLAEEDAGIGVITSEGTTISKGEEQEEKQIPSEPLYIGNKSNMKLHKASCTGKLPKESNRQYFDSLEEAIAAGYEEGNQCQICKPFR